MNKKSSTKAESKKSKLNYKGLSEEKEKKLAELVDTLQRLQAEFENFRNRTDIERQAQIKFASKNLISNLLEVLDSLDKAVAKSSDSEGFELVRKQFVSVLKQEGLEVVESIGADFDPELHEVLSSQESDKNSNTVLDEVRKGYTLKGAAIRPAQVIISKIKSDNGQEDK